MIDKKKLTVSFFSKINCETRIMILFAISLLKEYFLDGALIFITVSDVIRIIGRLIDVIIYSGGLLYVCKGKYTKREVIILIIGTLLIFIVALCSGELGLIPFWMWIILVKQVAYEKWIKTSLYCNCVGMLAGIIATFLGVHQDMQTVHRSVLGTRYTLGMQWPNLTGNIMFLIATSYIWLKKEKLKKMDYLIPISILAIVFVFMNSLGATVVLAVFIFTVFLFQYVIQNKEIIRNGLFILFFTSMVFGIISIILGVINVAEIPFLARMDTHISYRYTDVYRTYNILRFSVFGQKFNFSDLNLYAQLNGERNYYMDCMWMSLPIHYGIVFSIFFVYIYFSSMYSFVKKGEIMTVIIFFCGALYAMVQQIWPFLFIWIFMVFLAEPLFYKDLSCRNLKD